MISKTLAAIWDIAALTLAAAGLGTAPPCRAQSPAPDDKQLAFEVASIKPSAANGHFSFNVSPGGRLTATGLTLQRLILLAYNVGPRELSGGEDWIGSEKFDLIAKAPDGSLPGLNPRQAEVTAPNGRTLFSWTSLNPNAESTQQFREMVKALLAERFRLKIRTETKELPVYALVVGKSGPKLQESKAEGGPQMRVALGEIAFQNAPMTFLSILLGQLSGRVVQDHTGLKGDYDFKLAWTPDAGMIQRYRAANGMGGGMGGGGMAGMGAGGGAGAAAASAEPSGPSIFTGVQELGLKLEATKGPVQVLVIEHAEKPSEN